MAVGELPLILQACRHLVIIGGAIGGDTSDHSSTAWIRSG